jgi:hypothetical protein
VRAVTSAWPHFGKSHVDDGVEAELDDALGLRDEERADGNEQTKRRGLRRL